MTMYELLVVHLYACCDEFEELCFIYVHSYRSNTKITTLT